MVHDYMMHRNDPAFIRLGSPGCAEFSTGSDDT